MFRDVTPGINKDSLNCFWSPHHFHHPKAVALAASSSIQYIEDIIEEGALTEKQKKILFGVGTTLAFAIDTTGSMAPIIAATREQAIAIARGRLGTKDEPIDYVVAPFNDPSTGPVFKTTDFDGFSADVGSLSAFGGGDCPELAISGILDALEVMEGPADLFIMTDAVAKDFDLAPTAIEIAVNKRVSFHVFKFDSNCDDGSATKRDANGLERRVDSTANRQYSLLATSTGGTYHSLPVSDAGSISSLLDTLTLSESNNVLKLAGTLNETTSFDIPVDSKMTEFSISLRGAGVTLSLTKPDGSALDESSAGVTLSTVSDGQFLNVKEPASGVWKLTLRLASGSSGLVFSCDVTGVSPLHLSKFNFVALGGRPGHRGYYPISGQPAYNHDVAAVAVIDGTFDSATFDLRDSFAEHVVDTHMTQGTGAEGAPPTNSFYGEMRLLNQPLYAYVEGTDDAGAPFQRVLATVFQPFLSNSTDTGFNSTDIFAGRNNTNVTLSSTSIQPSSTVFNHSSTSLPIYSTSSSGNSSLIPYPTASSKGHYYSGYPVPIHTWDHTSYEPTSSGYIKTHTKYATEGCDTLKPSTYTTTSTCTVTDEAPTPYTTVSTITVTTYVPVLCATCTGENYPHHTGKGPWEEEDKSVIVSGYGTCVSTVDVTPTPHEHDYSTYPTVTKEDYVHYTAEPSSHAEYEYEHGYETATTTYTESLFVTREESYPTSVKHYHHHEEYSTSADYAHYTAEPSFHTEYSHIYESSTCTKSDHSITKEAGESYPTGGSHYHHEEYSTSADYVHHEEYSASVPDYEHHYTETGYEHYTYSSPTPVVSYPSYSASKSESESEVPYGPTYSPEPSHYDVPSSPSVPEVPSGSPYIPPPVYTATVSAPVYSVNGTVTVKGSSSATAGEYAPAEFTGGAVSRGVREGVLVVAVGAILFF